MSSAFFWLVLPVRVQNPIPAHGAICGHGGLWLHLGSRSVSGRRHLDFSCYSGSGVDQPDVYSRRPRSARTLPKSFYRFADHRLSNVSILLGSPPSRIPSSRGLRTLDHRDGPRSLLLPTRAIPPTQLSFQIDDRELTPSGADSSTVLSVGPVLKLARQGVRAR